ncbi:hypothetical protein FRC09_001107, partial [Ceratobasidium sp. 395]
MLAKSNTRLKVMKVDAVMQALERLKEVAAYQYPSTGKEKAADEYMMNEEEGLQDEDTCSLLTSYKH